MNIPIKKMTCGCCYAIELGSGDKPGTVKVWKLRTEEREEGAQICSAIVQTSKDNLDPHAHDKHEARQNCEPLSEEQFVAVAQELQALITDGYELRRRLNFDRHVNERPAQNI